MTLLFNESAPDDDELVVEASEFAMSLGDDLIADALAAVEKREAESQQRRLDSSAPIDLAELAAVESELDIEVEDDDEEHSSGIDLSELAAVESELALEIEGDDEEGVATSFPNGDGTAEDHLRARSLAAERDALRTQVEAEKGSRNELSAKLKRLSDQADLAGATTRNALEARRVAETRVKGLKEALEKQQGDISRMLMRRKQERSEDFGRGKGETILVLADGIDNLMLALTHTKSNPDMVFEGVRMVLTQFEGNLKKLGGAPIRPAYGDEFDPELHQAVGTEDSLDLPEGRIVDVMTQGYRLDGRLLRAARVSVAGPLAKKKKPEAKKTAKKGTQPTKKTTAKKAKK